MAELPISAQDHLLVNTITAIVMTRVFDAKRESYWLDLLAETLPHTTQNHNRIAPIARAADQLIKFTKGTPRMRAHLDASAAIAAWSEWRIARAQEVVAKHRSAA
ncbi:MAG: hypothetical protein AAF408_00820 [Pseudomonadota bacterium]